ncbi:GUN4 domain-containing protein [Nodosilinea nodulosa]|uniref:GUN4 domain-containing protein n=1 Tax=Nodosilinea nodulosa TaxID=416001 RepID=UPI0003069F3C|nr:GUN4 domain-containing protein [Nodosilinea nodulosa]
MTEQQFDVFLAHSSKDKPLIRRIYRKLADLGLHPWLDEEEIVPGTKFQDEIQQAIGRIKTAAIFFGHGGLGRWQALELRSFISQCVKRDIPIIPVLLPGVEEIPEELIFLQEFHAVSFQDSIEDEKALYFLEWGITQRRPTRQYGTSQTSSDTSGQRPAGSAPPISPPVALPSAPEDDLSSEKGIDYRNLRDLLKAGQWREADSETYEKMILAVGKKSGDWFTSDELLNFPCTDLLTIDRLWVKYSHGKFGFSVQKKIYVDCGAKLDGKYPGDKIWQEFCDRVGWRKAGNYLSYKDLQANPSLSPAEFPFLCGWSGRWVVFWVGVWVGVGGGWGRVSSLASRLVNCSR